MKKHVMPVVIACFIAIVFGTIYMLEQQSLRLSANDPQIQMAQDVANSLNNGDAPSRRIESLSKVDMAKSLAPYVIVYSKSGQVIAGSGYLITKSL